VSINFVAIHVLIYKPIKSLNIMKKIILTTGITVLVLVKGFSQCFSLSDNVNGQICLGASAQLYATQHSTCGGVLTFSWYPWGHVGNNFVITPTVTTVYTVVASNSATLTGTIVVNPLPTINLTANPTIIFCNSSINSSTITASGASTYTWLPNNWPLFMGVFVVTPISNMVYSVSGTDAVGCTNTGTVLVQYDNTACPCTNCNNGMLTGTLSGGSFGPGAYCVNNDITINGPVMLNNADLTLATGVKITVVPPGMLTITNSHLYACNSMWQGIVIKNGASVFINGSLIEDAVEAIDVTNNISHATIFDVDNTTFNRCYYAIDIENYTEQILSYPFNIRNCVFTSRDIPYTPLVFPSAAAIGAAATNAEAPLSNAYIDNSVYSQTNSNSTLKFPYTGSKPGAGIRLTNVGLTLNPNSASPTYYEYEHGSINSQLIFDNLGVGVDLYNSNCSVYNSVFQNSGYGIRADATPIYHNRLQVMSVAGTSNRFADCGAGISTRYYFNHAISGADFRTTWGSSLNMVGQPLAIDIWTNRYRDCRIEDNFIYNMYQGVGITTTGMSLLMPGINNANWGYFGQYAGSMYVNRNIMRPHLPNNTVTYQSLVTGINMQMYANQFNLYLADPTTQIVQVDKNQILDTENGIFQHLWQWLNQSCNSNTVTLVNPVQSNLSWGIALSINKGTSTQPAKVANNVITGYGTSNPNSWGITIGACAYQDVNCNTVSNVTHGFDFNFLNTNINFNNNEMNGNLYGMVCRNNGEIGTQGTSTRPQDNLWTGVWSSPNYKTALLTGADAANSKLYIRTSAPGNYNPDGSSLSTTPLIVNTEYSIANGNLIVSSSSPAPATCPIDISTARMAFGPRVADTVQLSALVSRKPARDRSVNYNVRTLLYDLANLQGYQPTGTDILSSFYSEQSTGSVGLFAAVEKSLFSRQFKKAAQLNESIRTESSAEENSKLYYRTAIHHFEGAFSSGDSAVLHQLVTKCPYYDGLVVEKARALYNMRFGWKLFANTCVAESTQELTAINENEAGAYQLYPNPTSGEVNVLTGTLKDGAMRITVCDITGRKVYQKTHQLQGGTTRFALDHPAGVYLVTLSSAGSEIKMKLIIQK
jgi:hypothetical protein